MSNDGKKEALERIFAEVLGQESGGAILTHLCLQFGLDQRCFTPDSNKAVDPWRAGVRDGERAVVLHILKMIARGKGEKSITIPVTP